MSLLSALLASATLLAPVPPPEPPRVHLGRAGDLAVKPPRLDGAPVVDGVLDEAMWREAAVLTGFSQFTPVDGVAASDSTEVFVWYSASALHIGIRAHDAVAPARATLAERDRIGNDDQIQLFLSTFNDGRQASYFAVNPLGVQADGALNESGRTSCSGFNCATQTREGPDLSQDFVWQSKGRLTPTGYEVEIRIPFKSIRFQQAATQTWGINVLRVAQRSGQEQTWAPVKRGAASFLAQSGRLEGLTGLQAGLVLDVVPTLTSRVDGAGAPAPGDRWQYGGGTPEVGGNVRFGLTSNLTLNGTANPDFSQVESDVGQFAFDPRQALFFAERRPFFLDGNEQFDVPSGLIYTRRIVQPVVATKLTGKVSGTQIGLLAAVDDDVSSRHGENPLFGIVRLTRDLGPGSRIGALWTEQHDGPDMNRVVDIDGRLVLGGIHSLTFQGALAHDARDGTSHTAPLWSLGYRRDGRAFRARYGVSGIDPDFRTRSGFISRAGIARGVAAHSYTWLRTGRTLEAITGEVVLDGTWRYDDFVGGREVQDRKLHLNLNARLAGGWNVGASLLDENFGYEPTLYTNYRLLAPDGSLLPFTGTPRLPNRDYLISMSSPAMPKLQFNGFVLWGRDENFLEWASGDILWITAGATFRPTPQLRLNLSYNHQQVNRPGDGSQVLVQMVPRARLEYQVTRALQVRLVSQYAIEEADSLRDDSRTGLPIVTVGPGGSVTRAVARRSGDVRNDLLLAYFPNPGTVFYLGYGASHRERTLDDRSLLRTNDGLFVKLSYLWRVQG